MSDGASAGTGDGAVLIKDGLIAGPAAPPYVGDVLLVGDRIAAVGGDLSQGPHPGPSGAVDAAVRPGLRTLDARGRYVLPGGVDPHVHLDTVFRGRRTADDFASGSRGAVAGGTTTLLDFCFPESDESLPAAVLRWRSRVSAQRPRARLGCHLVLVEPTDSRLDELADCIPLGVRSVKLYLAYPGRTMSTDGAVLRTMQRAADLDLTVLVHAESGHAIDTLIGQALSRGNTTPDWHGRTRPPELEAESVNRACTLAEISGAAVHVVHLSSAAALDVVVRARRRGVRVTAETCPHYLLLDVDRLDTPVDRAAPFVCSPPLRGRADRDRLWAALSDGSLDFVASDHCAFLTQDKVIGPDFTQIMNGIPGVEQRLVLLHEFGVLTGRLSVAAWVRLTSTAAADIYRLPGGRLRPGDPADVIVVDPTRVQTLAAETQHCAIDVLPYAGMTVRGAVEDVFVAGRHVVARGEPGPDANAPSAPLVPARVLAPPTPETMS